ncbi:MAG: Rpn family recombination-promoting nuclease/putative transposase [Lachnospiraceae bacterium]|nr:Rpn family recombination-promoting nuclease/putative transposase [Lachnospiraceae bacterium]
MNRQRTLYEHQSTANPNMPLRDLFYVSKEYKKLINKKTLYSRHLIKIPAPHFIVFYNGVESQPETQVLKLSDLYQTQEKEPKLELKVLMLNINDGNNEELKESCQVLKEYMQYVNRVRKYVYQEKMELDGAVELAVTECIKEGILEEFLRENRAEVVAMSIFEFDEEREMKLIKEVEYQHGFKKGREEGQKGYLIECICKKLRKGKNLNVIAEELEEEVSAIEEIYLTAKKFAPEYDAELILQKIGSD